MFDFGYGIAKTCFKVWFQGWDGRTEYLDLKFRDVPCTNCRAPNSMVFIGEAYDNGRGSLLFRARCQKCGAYSKWKLYNETLYRR